MEKVSYNPVFNDAEVSLNDIENALNMPGTIEIDIIEDFDELLLSDVEETDKSAETDTDAEKEKLLQQQKQDVNILFIYTLNLYRNFSNLKSNLRKMNLKSSCFD